ncbi:hypothetical protein BS47DRAFT_1380018 [Hydnum rufescens UP504]|uniref:Uncharacterized protein n=1 Tax=Hydnum rufescens UP504 TaxID=1448309 RepID=A0A9P6DX24_9AGAM|nr:hypothetical protein BS47DRAFT_1380018 [Hydnum rufescens UP504]
MSTIQHKYIVTSGILGVDPGFKALNWHGDIDTMFSIGIIHLLAWFAATQVHVTDIYARADNPYIVALIADEDIEHAMDTLVGKHELTVRGRESMVHVSICCATSTEEVETLGFQKLPRNSVWSRWSDHRRKRKTSFDYVSVPERRRDLVRSLSDLPNPFPQPIANQPLQGLRWYCWMGGSGGKRKEAESDVLDEARLCDNLHSYKCARTEGGSDFMDTSPTSPTCIAQLSHAATPLPADDGMDGMDVDELPMPGTRDTNEAHEDTADKLPASPTRAPDPPPADDGMHIDEPPVSGSGDVGKAHDTAVIPNYFCPPCPHIIEDWVFFEC